MRAGERVHKQVNPAGSGRMMSALRPASGGNVAVGDPADQVLVSPGDIMDMEEAGEETEEGEEVIQMSEEVERVGTAEVGRQIRRLVDPRKPTQAEVDEHELTHVPYRNWCPICVRCRGKDLDHRKAVEDERGVSEYAFEYCFPGDEFGHKLVVLAGRERVTGMYFATAVPTKGSIGRFAVDKALDFIHELGDRGGRILVKTDQEPAIRTWARDLSEAREDGRTILEESPVKSSGSNGRAERAVQALEGQIRVLLLSLEARVGQKVDAREPIVSDMPEYAAYLLNQLDVGKDDKTSCGPSPWAENVLYKVKSEATMNKIRPRWDFGIFVGVRPASNEVWIATADKTFAVRCIRRLPFDQRWGPDNVGWVRRTLWNR